MHRMNRPIVRLRSRGGHSTGFDDIPRSRLSSSLRSSSEFRRNSTNFFHHAAHFSFTRASRDHGRIQRQGNELSRESRSCTSWPHLQRISSYSPAMRGSRYARRTSYRKCFLPIWRCASRARSSEEELSDTFHRYGQDGTVCHYASVSSRPSLAE